MRKSLLWMLLGGMAYYALEGVWRIPTNGGWANISMLPVGGLCFVLVGGINQIPVFYHLSMRMQAAIGSIIVLVVEFIAGYIINIRLGLGIWDYSDMPFNIAGQVCLLYGILWFLLIPFGVWLEDRMTLIMYSYYLYRKKTVNMPVVYDYTLPEAYKELISFK